MKITNYLTLSLAACLAWAGASACQVSPESKNTAANPPVVKSTANANQPASMEPDKAASAGSLATPSEAYKAAYTARQKKDIEGLKRVLSQELLGFLTEIAQADKKTVDDQLKELVAQPQAGTAESRNEKITGDTATLEYLSETGKWSTMDFVKEGNDWKLTLPNAKASPREDMKKK